MPFLNTIINNILDIVFPVRCISCGTSGQNLCEKCLSLCGEAERESQNWIFPLFDYRDPVIKKAIWLIKYKGKKRLVHTFGELLYGKIVEELSDLSIMQNFNDAILIPIPLSKARQRERGFNQAELLCQKIIEFDKNQYLKLEKNILIKTKDTPHQAHIKDRRERLKNLTDSFAVKNAELIKRKNIILIDDVTTTGATFGEAKRALKSAGARKVIAFAIAH